MKRRIRISQIGGLLLLGTTSLLAEPITINLEKAIEIALSESPTIKVADKEIERKQYAKKEVVSKLIPSINGTGSYQYAIEKQRVIMNLPNVGEQTMKMGSDHSLTFGLSAAVPLVAPTLWQNLNVTEVDIERSVDAARTSRLNMVKSVKNGFYNVLLSENSLDVIQKNYLQAVANYENTKEKVRVGTASEYEEIRAEVQVRNLEPNVYQAESAVRSSYLQLKALLGFDSTVDLKVEGVFQELENNMYSAVLIADSIHLSNNPNIRKLDLEIKYMNASLKMQQMQRIPSLNLSVGYNYMTMGNNGTPINEMKWFPNSTLGLSLSVPIFEGLAKNHREKQTKIGIESIKLQKLDTERQLNTQKQVYVDNIKKCIKQIESSKKGILSAEKGRDIAKKRYDVGAGSYLEYNDAEVALLQAQLSYNQSLFNYVSAKFDLENLIGSYPLQ